MNRDKIASKIRLIIGHYNFVRLQSYIKYSLNFRKYYYNGSKKITPPSLSQHRKTFVYMADGRTSHGGFSDRLRGIFSLYEYCKKNNFDFKIYFVHPFKLDTFLLPNDYNWWIEEKDLIFDKRLSGFRFINSYSDMNEEIFDKFLRSDNDKIQIHVYSNWTNHEEKFFDYFRCLFRISPFLDKYLVKYANEIGGPYVSISFRFISLLGDFKDSYFAHETNEVNKQYYLDRCKKFISRIHNQYPQYQKILITADSNIFINEIKDLPYVYIIKGNIVHMDYVSENISGHLKTMIDYFLISKADKVFCYSCGEMFKATKFAKTAALIGGKEFYHINE